MKKIFAGILTAAILLLSPTVRADKAELLDSLTTELSKASTAADSVPLMYNIFDLSERKNQANIAWQLLDISERTGDETLGLNMLRNLANLYLRNDSIFSMLEKKCMEFPESEDRTSTATFIALRRAEYIARCAPETERLEKIKEVIQQYRNEFHDASPYERVRQLGSLCILLGNNAHMALITKYIDQSVAEINTIPASDIALRNVILNQAANIYTNINQPEKAIAVDHELLNIMEWMAENYHANGRPYRNFDRIKFTTYRNMLQNYEGLSEPQIEQYYDSIQALAARNIEVAQAIKLRIAEAYYMIGTKRYPEAIELFEAILERPTDNFNRMRALHNLIKASKAIGDQERLLKYTTKYNNELEEFIRLSAQETYNELQTIYDVTQLQIRNTQLELEHTQSRVNHQRTLIIGGIILFLIMLAVIFILTKLIRKSRHLTSNLAESNEALETERINLLDTQQELIKARDEARTAEQHKARFIENMSSEITNPINAIVEYSNLIVDCVDSDKRKYLMRYADIVKLNTELLSNTVHDILEVRQLEDPTLTLNRQPVLIGDICRMAVDSVKPSLQEGVTISFEQENDPDFHITTDHLRVEQVLINLLHNAAKFTPKGHISLSYIVDRPNNSLTFAVTDTGIGIPEGHEEEIFTRFRKLHNDTPGSGLGLPICRMIAELMQGTVVLDRSYNKNDKRGARFLFTIPLIDILP